MSVAAMQTAMTRMLVDDDWRVRFMQGDIRPPDLSDEEAACLRRADLRLLEVQAAAGARKRTSLALELLPLSARLLSPVPEHLMRCFVRRHPSAAAPRLEALRMAALLDEYLESGEVGDPHIRDLLHYEATVLRILESLSKPATMPTGGIAVSKHAAVISARVDLVDLVNRLEAGEEHPRPVTGAVTLLVVVDDGAVTLAEIDGLDAEILSLCKRPTSVSAITALLDSDECDVGEAVQWLTTVGAVTTGWAT